MTDANKSSNNSLWRFFKKSSTKMSDMIDWPHSCTPISSVDDARNIVKQFSNRDPEEIKTGSKDIFINTINDKPTLWWINPDNTSDCVVLRKWEEMESLPDEVAEEDLNEDPKEDPNQDDTAGTKSAASTHA